LDHKSADDGKLRRFRCGSKTVDGMITLSDEPARPHLSPMRKAAARHLFQGFFP
jgi:hypothetical protein